jgi:DNA-binding beta-propeller fold protein YncE
VSSAGVLSEQSNSPYAVAAADPVSVQVVNTNLMSESTGGLFVYVGQGGGVGALYPFTVCWVQNANCSAQDVAGNLMVPLATCPALSCNVAPSSVGSNPVAMLADPTNNFLYVLSEGQNRVSAFKINTTAGSLTALNPPDLPTGSQPVSMAMHASVNSTGQGLYSSSGQFLYTSNAGSSNITGTTLNTTSGSMSNPFTVVAPAAPSGIAVH